MKYKVKPMLIPDNENYRILCDEIMQFKLIELNQILEGFDKVFNGSYSANSFSGNHMAVVDYDTNLAKISHFDDVIGEEPTIDIYNMLKEYRDRIIESENKQNS